MVGTKLRLFPGVLISKLGRDPVPNPELDKVPNGQNPEKQNSELDKVPNWTKSRIEPTSKIDKVRISRVLTVGLLALININNLPTKLHVAHSFVVAT